MSFDNRLWKLDLENLWWNENRLNILNSLIKLAEKEKFKAHLTGDKGVGKSTIIEVLKNKIKDVSTYSVVHHIKSVINPDSSYLIIDEVQILTPEERLEIIQNHSKVLMVSVVDLSYDGYDYVYKIEALKLEEVASYITKYSDKFDETAFKEIYLASRGRCRLINLLCKACLKESENIDKNLVEQIAKRKYKLRY